MFQQQHRQEQQHMGGAGDLVVLVNQGNQHAIDVDKSKTTNGTDLLVYPKHTPPTPNQQWHFEYRTNNQFMIVSALNPNSVIDVPSSKAKSGTKLGLWEKNGGPNQLWEWQNGVIHSALGHDLVMAQHGGDHGTLIIETRSGHPNQMWQQVRH